ncbi:MAG: acyltransferase [Alphaproteobacteria bacterium]|nr:acyltransferase [Alphaproteobacteria bacterium]
MKHVKEYDALRGLMALWVLLGHWASTVPIHNVLFQRRFFNEYAVDVFIILSGFAIAMLILAKQESYRAYITRRFFRIFPAYLFYLAVSVALAGWALDLWQAAPEGSMKEARVVIAQDSLSFIGAHTFFHLLGLHSLVPPALLPSSDFAFLGQAWSISLEWQFYLIAPFVVALFTLPVSRTKAIVMAMAIAVIAALNPVMGFGFIGKFAVPFAVGIATAFFLRARKEQGRFAAQIPVGLTWLVLTGLCVLQGSLEFLPYCLWFAATAVALSAHEQTSKVAGLLSAIALTPPLQWLGKVSYSVYLSHMLVLMGALSVLLPMGFGLWTFSLALLGATLVGTAVASALSYALIEKPFQDLGKRLASSSAPQASESPQTTQPKPERKRILAAQEQTKDRDKEQDVLPVKKAG